MKSLRHLGFIVGFVVAAFVLSQAPLTQAAMPGAATTPRMGTVEILPPDSQSPIKHVIIAIYENHGFDNVFSGFPGAFGDPPDGVPQPLTQDNVSGYNIPYNLGWSYGGNESSDVPDHDVEAIEGNEDNGSMDGFSYTDTNVSDGMFPSWIMPNSHGLAEEYGLADNYFHAYAGPTLPNRFYYYAITSGPITGDSGPANGSNKVYFPSLPQELEQYGLSWASFDGNYNEYNGTAPCLTGPFPNCPSWYFDTTLSQLMPLLYFNWIQEYAGQLGHIQTYTDIMTDISSGTLPAVSWYTPDWVCCTEHPGTIAGFGGNITQGEESLLQLVAAVETSPYWNSTAIFVSYDEGGGFYDHVPSPQLTSVGDGVRIPLMVISAYAKEGYISHEYLTQTSLLKFIEWNWNLPPLGTLDADANNLLGFFNFSAPPRPPLPTSILDASNSLTSYPWVLQPVSSSYTGSYVSPLVSHGNVSWSDETNNTVASSPTPSPNGQTLYLSGMDGFLRAYGATTGQVEWQRDLGSASRSAPTVLPDGDVVVTTLRGSVTAYDAQGGLLWNLSLGAPIYGSLALVHGALYGALQEGNAFEIDLNGSVEWNTRISFAALYSTPAWDATDGLLLYSASNWGVVAVNLTGVTKWVAHVPGGVWSTGALYGTTLYVAGSLGDLWPIDAATGAVGTPLPLNATVAPPVISGNTLYIGTTAGIFQTFDLNSVGATLGWGRDLYGGISTAALVEGSSVWVASEGGDLYEYPASGGSPERVLVSQSSLWGAPVQGGQGWIYFTAEDGNVFALGLGQLDLHVSPSAAAVTVDGAGIALNATGSAVLSLKAGSYTVNASAAGYTPQTTVTTLATGHVTYLNITLSKTSVPTGTLEGLITPASATLSVNGSLVVLASGAYQLSENPGPYALVASAPGYLSQWVNVSVRSNLVTYWNASLVPSGGTIPGDLQVSLSPVSATLTVGGTNQPVSPEGSYFLQENPGPYEVEASEVGYLSQWANLTVDSGAISYWNVTLVPSAPPAGTIDVRVDPTTAYLSLDLGAGATSASGSFAFSASPGTHELEAYESGYDAQWTNVSVVADRTSYWNVTLLSSGPTATTAWVEGFVTDATGGTPVVTAHVSLAPGDHVGLPASNGLYNLTVTAGTFTLFVNATGFQAFVRGLVATMAGRTTWENVSLTPSSTGGTNPGNGNGSTSNLGQGFLGISGWLWLLLVLVVAAVAVIVVVITRRRPADPAADEFGPPGPAEWEEPASPPPG